MGRLNRVLGSASVVSSLVFGLQACSLMPDYGEQRVALQEEMCDGADNDHDGYIDEACRCDEAPCHSGLECVTPLLGNAPPTCHRPCDDFCDSSCLARPDTISVASLGAAPDDGVSDYGALKALADTVSERELFAPSAHVVFSPGVYEVTEYLDACTPSLCPVSGRDGSANTADHIRYHAANNVHFHGCGATVSVGPTPFRVVDRSTTVDMSLLTTVIPFYITESHRFTIEGFELNGNVDDPATGRVPTVAENSSHGIVTAACSDYEIRDVDAHHFAADGIILGFHAVYDVVSLEEFDPVGQYDCPGYDRSECVVRVYARDERGTLVDVQSHHNARGALSVILVDRLDVYGGSFSFSGETGNPQYPGHAPSHGLNVEPDFAPIPAFVGSEGYASEGITQNLFFTNSTFSSNLGPQVSAGTPSAISGLYVHQSEILVGPESHRYSVRLKAPNVYIAESDISLRDTQVVMWEGCEDPGLCTTCTPTSAIFVHNVIHATGARAINSVHTNACPGLASPSVLVSNAFTFDGPPPSAMNVDLRGAGAVFSHNTVNVHAAAHRLSGDPSAGTHQTVVNLANIEYSENNEFRLVDPSLLPEGARFRTTYSTGFPVSWDEFPDNPEYYPWGGLVICDVTPNVFCR